jgi:hypothetical protein
MKTSKWIVCLLLSSASSVAFAANNSITPEETGDNACLKIRDACREAGFGKGSAKGSAYKKCFMPLLRGKTVEGVTVDESQIAACKALRKPKKKKS